MTNRGMGGAARPSRHRFLQGAAVLGLGGGVLASCGDDDDNGAAPVANGSGANGNGDIPSARIGYVTPRTGPLAPFGEADAFVPAAMRQERGEAVEILDRDSESDSGRAGEVAQELISEGVDLIVVSSTPDTTVPVAAACDLGEAPCISTVAPWQPPLPRHRRAARAGCRHTGAGVGVQLALLLGPRGRNRELHRFVGAGGRRQGGRWPLAQRSRRQRVE